MKDFLLSLWNDEEGVETVEWVGVAIVILIVLFIAYQSGLATEIQSALNSIGSTLVSKTGTIT